MTRFIKTCVALGVFLLVVGLAIGEDKIADQAGGTVVQAGTQVRGPVTPAAAVKARRSAGPANETLVSMLVAGKVAH
jgi:hypothetical protein